MRRRALGVDFSGARDAGRAIWIAEGAIGRRGFELAECRPATELPGGARDRATALAALAAYLGAQSDAVIGCDFPVGLPKKLVRETDWPGFLARFPQRHASADEFRADCRKRSERELRRPTDIEAKTPFCAWNFRLYRQTYHGIADLLAPLVAAGACDGRADAAADRGSRLDARDLSRLGAEEARALPSLQGPDGSAHAEPRRDPRRAGRAWRARETGTELRSRLIEDRGGDALDAVIACLAAAAAARRKHPPASAEEMLGGKVYFDL